jgi:hypothetical protein
MLFARIMLLVAVCSQHHLLCLWDITPSSPTTKIQDKADSPPHPSNADNHDAADDNTDNDAAYDNAEDNADANAENANTTQTTDDDTDDNTATQLTGDDAEDDNNAASDIDAVMKRTK